MTDPSTTAANPTTTASTATVTTTDTPPVAVAAVPKRAWADEVADELANEEGGSNSPDLIDSLKIDEVQSLDEPEESNITTVSVGDMLYTSASTFEDLNLSPELLKALYVEMNFQKPSKIQAITLPMILTPPYKDLVAQAHNGSGKTTCFVLGMLSRVNPILKSPQALCICPTRELAIQNIEVLKKMGKYTGITSELAVPTDSASYVPMSKRSPISAQVVIGTPGTVKKWMSSKKLGLSCMKILVFDEADHMLAEDGFKDDSLRIMKDIEKNSSHCQILLFSATFNDNVRHFISRVIRDHNQLFVEKKELSLEGVKQFKVLCPDELSKIKVIKNRIFEYGEKLGQTIIFVRTRNSAGMLHKALVEFGYDCSTIMGAHSNEERDIIVKEFKDGLTTVLISTDLLARGFDQQQVNLVINYDLPVKHEPRPDFQNRGRIPEPDYEVYLHRVGRTGRFGRKGAVFNLLCTDTDIPVMARIQEYFGSQVIEVKDSVEDFERALKMAGIR